LPSRWNTCGTIRPAFFRRLCSANEFNEPLDVRPWWHDGLAALDDPLNYELLFSLPRQTGKSQFGGVVGSTEVLCCPGSYTLLVAASKQQQTAIFERKIRGPLERALGPKMRKELGARFTQHGIVLDRYGSQLEVIASNEATGTGRTPSLLIVDTRRSP